MFAEHSKEIELEDAVSVFPTLLLGHQHYPSIFFRGYSGGAGTDISNIGWSFAPAATNFLFFVAQLPHTYKEGTSLNAHIHWEPSNTDTGNVLWRMSYRWRNNGETAAAMTDVDITVSANGTALTLQIDSFASISKTDALISSILDIQLSRIGGDAADTFTGNAILKEFDIHYMVSSDGSINEWSK